MISARPLKIAKM